MDNTTPRICDPLRNGDWFRKKERARCHLWRRLFDQIIQSCWVFPNPWKGFRKDRLQKPWTSATCPQLPSTALANKHLRVHLLTFLCGVGDECCSDNSAAKISRQWNHQASLMAPSICSRSILMSSKLLELPQSTILLHPETVTPWKLIERS